MPFMRMEHSADPAQVIYDRVGMNKKGEIPGFKLHGNRVLIGIYERPSKMKAIKTVTGQMVSLEIPDTVKAEDKSQGKAGVILMVGTSAFKDDDVFSFHGDNVEVGDWVMVHVSYGLACVVNGQLCRIVRDQDVGMLIPSPDSIF